MTLASLPSAHARIAAFYARGLVDYLRLRGVDANTLLPEVPMARPEAMAISPEVSLVEWARLLDAATVALGEPDFPAKAGESLQLHHLGALGQVLMNCATLEEASHQLARYIRLLGQIGQPMLTIRGVEAHLLWQWPYPGPAPQSVALFMLAARVRFMRWLSDRPDLNVDACFHGAAPGAAEGFTRVFGGRVEFGAADSKLIFPAAYLMLPVVGAEEKFRGKTREYALPPLPGIASTPALLREIKAVLMQRLSSGRVQLSETANSLHLSTRTLQRKLSELGLHYQQVLDHIRAESAEQLLRDPSIPLTQIAFMLGYSDQSTFQAAYRRWRGVSPGKSRRRQRD